MVLDILLYTDKYLILVTASILFILHLVLSNCLTSLHFSYNKHWIRCQNRFTFHFNHDFEVSQIYVCLTYPHNFSYNLSRQRPTDKQNIYTCTYQKLDIIKRLNQFFCFWHSWYIDVNYQKYNRNSCRTNTFTTICC